MSRNEYSVAIDPVEVVETKTIKHIRYTLHDMKIGAQGYASFLVHQMNDAGKLLDVSVLKMDTMDYLLWGVDDSFIENWILQKLGFSRLLPSPGGSEGLQTPTTEEKN